MVSERGNPSHDLIHLVLHFALGDSHPIDKNCVINLLLADALIISLEVLVLHLGAILGTL